MNNNNKRTDRYWTVEEIRPYIIKFLKEKFPDSIIEREFSHVDIMILGHNIPVEIQRTTLQKNENLAISQFEDMIRRQIEQNISIFGQCWLFFDDKLLYHLQNDLAKNVSINMDWLYQFFKTRKLKVFTITLDGVIKELTNHDFEFIKNFSNTCKLSNGEEHRILERNKSKIAYKLYKGIGITTEEINRIYNEYENDGTRIEPNFKQWLRNKGDRYKELTRIKESIDMISCINDMLKCVMQNRHAILYASYLGIIDGNGRGYNRIRCSDYYNILEDLPGYFVKQELWDYWKTSSVANNMFIRIVRGEYPNYLRDYKNQKSIEDAWS